MASIFSHRSPTPMTTQDYRRFRPYIREDFNECCAYCLLHELLAGGTENFELDHFKPKSRYPDLTHMTNLALRHLTGINRSSSRWLHSSTSSPIHRSAR